MLPFDKVEAKPLFHQQYPLHFLFCPGHQIKSKLTDIITHLRAKCFGKQTVTQTPPRFCQRHTRQRKQEPLPDLTHHAEQISDHCPRQGEPQQALTTHLSSQEASLAAPKVAGIYLTLCY